MHSKSVKWMIITLVLLVISGCATLGGSSKEEIVKQRVAERWTALIEGRLETAYEFETPEYRELYPFSDFRKKVRGVGSWQKVDVESIRCETDKCVATIRVYVRIQIGLGFEAIEKNGQATEKWIHHTATGQWYHITDR